MTRVAFYARYSSDNQRDASIEDQLRQCRERAVGESWTVVNSYFDRAISSASLIRSGIQLLLADALAGRLDMVLSEALTASAAIRRTWRACYCWFNRRLQHQNTLSVIDSHPDRTRSPDELSARRAILSSLSPK